MQYRSKRLVNNYFLAHCFHGYTKHIFSPQELYESIFALALRNCIIRGEPERAPNTRETGSGFIILYTTKNIFQSDNFLI